MVTEQETECSFTCSQAVTDKGIVSINGHHQTIFPLLLTPNFSHVLTLTYYMLSEISSCVPFLCLWFNFGPSFSLKLLKFPSFDAPQSHSQAAPFLLLWNHSFISISYPLLSGSFVTNRSFGFRIWRLKIKLRQKCYLQLSQSTVYCLNKENTLQGIWN